jgi:hypothetical protein
MATLTIDGQLREPDGVDQLLRYAFNRLRTGLRTAAAQA